MSGDPGAGLSTHSSRFFTNEVKEEKKEKKIWQT